MSPSSRPGLLVTRRAALACAGVAVSVAFQRPALALEPEVPIRLQVSLLDRVIPFDRNFGSRVHGRLCVAVVVDPGSVDSKRIGTQVLDDLAERDALGNYPVVGARVALGEVQALIDECRRLQAGVVYVTPGGRQSIATLATALRGLAVLTVGTMPEQIAQGLVLGSAVRSGKPRVLVNLKEARQQGVDFRADFLRMAEVVG